MRRRVIRIGLLLGLLGVWSSLAAAAEPEAGPEYMLLATKKTSTMEKELNRQAAAGYRFIEVMGGVTALAGNETVSIMRRLEPGSAERYEYKVLATTRTSTMEKELRQAGSRGFRYRGQTIYDSTFGGREVVVIVERRLDRPDERYEYRLLATRRTSTMQKELEAAARDGFEFLGFTVAATTFGGHELVAITSRAVR